MKNALSTSKVIQPHASSKAPPMGEEEPLNVRQAAYVISRLILEIVRGDRPLQHIRPWVDPARYELVSQKIGTILQLWQGAPPVARPIPTIKALCVLPISHSIYEVSVVAHSFSRFRALALRLEKRLPTAEPILKNRISTVKTGSWKATAVEIG